MEKISKTESQSAIAHLQNLIRINTTNPPGNEFEACRYLAKIFDEAGIAYQILESAPGRANIIARVKGDGSQKPLLLTSHLDVVPCEKSKWEVDPFGAVIKDGCVWGRGAVDMKNMTAMELTVFLKAHREKMPLKRDLIFVAVADEERGCTYGSKWLVENHPELIQAEYGLNEVGGYSLPIEGKTFYPIGVAEKGLCWFEITATGTTGHGAMPHDDQALPRLCLACHQLATEDLPLHRSQLVGSFIDAVSRQFKFPQNIFFKLIQSKIFSNFIFKQFPDKTRARNLKNMLHNLATPTMVEAGIAENVIPSSASLTVDGRILPGSTVQSFLSEVQALIGPGFTIRIKQSSDPLEMPYENDFFDVLKQCLEKNDPGSIPVPFLIPGFTDSHHYHKLGIKCYGFIPTKLPPDLNFRALYHGHNERIPVDAIGFGVQVLWDVILRTCC